MLTLKIACPFLSLLIIDLNAIFMHFGRRTMSGLSLIWTLVSQPLTHTHTLLPLPEPLIPLNLHLQPLSPSQGPPLLPCLGWVPPSANWDLLFLVPQASLLPGIPPESTCQLSP